MTNAELESFVKARADKQARIIVELYEIAYRRIEQQIRIANSGSTTSDFLAARKILIRQIIRDLETVTTALMNNAIAQTYKFEITRLAETVDKSVSKPSLLTGTIQELQNQSLSYFKHANESIIENAEKALRKAYSASDELSEVNEKTAFKKLMNESDVTVRKDGRARLVKAGDKSFAMDYYADMVARSGIREASTAATIDHMDGVGMDLVEITSHAGGSTCPICGEFDGRIFSLSGTSSKYPKLLKKPPFHPRCRHVLTPAEISAVRISVGA